MKTDIEYESKFGAGTVKLSSRGIFGGYAPVSALGGFSVGETVRVDWGKGEKRKNASAPAPTIEIIDKLWSDCHGVAFCTTDKHRSPVGLSRIDKV